MPATWNCSTVTIQPPTMPMPPDMTRQQRHHEQPGEHARHDQLADRIGAERAQRGDLIGHHHRAELRGDARSDASGDHQAGQHRPELLAPSTR